MESWFNQLFWRVKHTDTKMPSMAGAIKKRGVTFTFSLLQDAFKV